MTTASKVRNRQPATKWRSNWPSRFGSASAFNHGDRPALDRYGHDRKMDSGRAPRQRSRVSRSRGSASTFRRTDGRSSPARQRPARRGPERSDPLGTYSSEYGHCLCTAIPASGHVTAAVPWTPAVFRVLGEHITEDGGSYVSHARLSAFKHCRAPSGSITRAAAQQP